MPEPKPAITPIAFDRASPAQPGEAKEWVRDPTGQFSAGLWAGAVDRFAVTYTEYEFCQILEGAVRLTDAAGAVHDYQAGDSFVIPAGFTGWWETVKPVRKFYVIYEPSSIAACV